MERLFFKWKSLKSSQSARQADNFFVDYPTNVLFCRIVATASNKFPVSFQCIDWTEYDENVIINLSQQIWNDWYSWATPNILHHPAGISFQHYLISIVISDCWLHILFFVTFWPDNGCKHRFNTFLLHQWKTGFLPVFLLGRFPSNCTCDCHIL